MPPRYGLKPSYMSGVARTHRLCATRISCAFRTISEKAALVIAGLVSVQELVRVAVEVEETVTSSDDQTRREARRPARERSISRWQERWDSTTSGRWTHVLIPVLSPWLERRHEQVYFYLTQILSGHECFRSYLKKYGHDTSDNCPSCGSGIEEDARHVLYECVRFVEDRTAQETTTGVSTSPSTLVPNMLRGQMEWDATAKFTASVMRKLGIAERERRGLDT